MKVYFDNAATTPVAPEVADVMADALRNMFGNPSSVHAFGRPVRSALENSRKKIAEFLNARPGEIFFTSGGTEADNFILLQSVHSLGVRHIITSPVEHHAVEHTARYIENKGWAKVHWLTPDSKGNISLSELEKKLKECKEPVLVSLMHANNEIGTLLPLHEAASLCKQYQALIHSDTVQTMGHYAFDLQHTPLDFLTAAAHKFHGPKGAGFMFIRKGLNVSPLIHGGAQERNVRGGTENVYGILGMQKAMELSYHHLEEHQQYVSGLKKYLMQTLKEQIPGVDFNGEIDSERSLYTVLNVRFPRFNMDNEMLLFNLDIAGIAASAGSACSSGSHTGSHVLRCIGTPEGFNSVRFSFSRYNTVQEADYVVQQLKKIFKLSE